MKNCSTVSYFTYALMNRHVDEEGKRLKKGSFLPEHLNWTIEATKFHQDKYIGVIYINKEAHQIVVVHKGTDDISELQQDLNGHYPNDIESQKEIAFNLTKHALNLAKEHRFHLSFTGYSWGALLAEWCVFYCELHHPLLRVNSVVFDGPGSEDSIKKMQPNLKHIVLNQLDCIEFVLYPNEVNTFSRHIGTLFYLQDPSGLPNAPRNMDRITTLLNPTLLSKVFYLKDWPISYKNDFPYRMDEWIDNSLSYNASLPLKHFSDNLREFLKDFYKWKANSYLKEEADSLLKQRLSDCHTTENSIEHLLTYKIEERNRDIYVLAENMTEFHLELEDWLAENESQKSTLYNAMQSPVTNKAKISWETLIRCVRANYLENDKIKVSFDEARDIGSCYVNLAIVEEKEQKDKTEKFSKDELSRDGWLNSYEELHGVKREILPVDIFRGENNQELKQLLLLGRAGIGKSVFCHYVAYQWARGTLWQDIAFTLLIWVPLRELANDHIYPKNGKPITLGKVLYEQIKEHLRAYDTTATEEQWVGRLDALLISHAAEVLYVLDGYDEVVPLLDKKARSRQTEVLETLLKQERVLITSRPYYIDHYLSSHGIKIERRLENIGFVEENIHDYIQRYIWEAPEQGNALSETIYQNSNLRGIAHIPINLALLCHHWRTLEETKRAGFNPTMTQLYEALVADLLLEHCGQPKGPVDFTDESGLLLFDNDDIQPVLWFLEKLAFLQMQDESLIITQDRIAGLLKKGKQLFQGKWHGFKEALGAGLLVSPDGKEKRFEERREHYFIHLTFQEFFAARYIARIFREEQTEKRSVATLETSKRREKISPQPLNEFIALHKYDLRYEIVWWFVSGLLKEHEAGLERFFDGLLAEPHDTVGLFEPLLWIKCLEECALKSRWKEALIRAIRERTEQFLSKGYHWWHSREYWFYSRNYKALWWDYVCSSPQVWKAIGVLQEQTDLIKAHYIFKWHGNLPPALLHRYANLLKSADEKAMKVAQSILMEQAILPSNLRQQLMHWLENLDVGAKQIVIKRLQGDLPSALVVVKIWLVAQWKKKGVVAVADIEKALGNFVISMPEEFYHWMATLLKKEEDKVRISVLTLLRWLRNLTEEVLIEIMTLWEKNTNEEIKEAAANVLREQKILFPPIFNRFKSLWQGSDEKAKEALIILLLSCKNLPEGIVKQLWGARENKEPLGRWAQLILAQQAPMRPSFLSHLVEQLNNPERKAREDALYNLGRNKALPETVLVKVIALLKKEEKGKINYWAKVALERQAALPAGIALELASWLQTNERVLKERAKAILIHRSSLPIQVIRLLLEDLYAYPCQWKEEDKISFLTHHWEALLHHEPLSLKLTSLPPLLLATVLLNKCFSGKEAVFYFNHRLFAILGHQLRPILAISQSLALEIVEALKKLQSYKDSTVAYNAGQEAEKRSTGRSGMPECQEAIAHYTAAIYLMHCEGGTAREVYVTRGWARLFCRDYQSAIEDITHGIARLSHDEQNLGYLARAWAYLLSMQAAEALIDIEHVLKLGKNSDEAYCVSALLALQDGDLVKGFTTAQRAVALGEQGIAFFILAQLYRVKGEKEAYQSTLLKAQERGDNQPLFSLLEEWLKTVEKQLTERNKETAQAETIEKSEISISPMPAFLPTYSACQSSFASFNQNNSAKEKEEALNGACEAIMEGTASLTLKSSP